MNRRAFVAGCCGCLVSAGSRSAIAAGQFPTGDAGLPAQFPTGDTKQPRLPRTGEESRASRSASGCYLNARDGQALGAQQQQLSRFCGIPWLDAMMPVEGQLLNRFYGVTAGFIFLIESQEPNAFATPDTLFPGTRGTVFFGVQLLREELSASPLGTIALAAIMGHEWGHILQFANNIQVPGKQMELSSDFMAGWWCGMKVLAGTPGVDILTVADSLYRKGDYAFNSPSHHGTPEERVKVLEGGYRAAIQGHISNAQAAFALSRQAVGL